MVKAKIVETSELMKDNPTLCLSPLRVFKECHKCDRFKKAKNPLKLKCKPQITKRTKLLLKRKMKLQEQLAKINKQLYEGD